MPCSPRLAHKAPVMQATSYTLNELFHSAFRSEYDCFFSNEMYELRGNELTLNMKLQCTPRICPRSPSLLALYCFFADDTNTLYAHKDLRRNLPEDKNLIPE